jgi:hypothetical protein
MTAETLRKWVRQGEVDAGEAAERPRITAQLAIVHESADPWMPSVRSPNR